MIKTGQRVIRNVLPCALALTVCAPLTAQVPKGVPLTYGTSATSYVEIPASAFMPIDSNVPYSGYSVRSSSSCSGDCFVAPVHLPSGAKLVYLELDFFDADPLGEVDGRLVTCDYLGNNCTNHPAAGAGQPDCLFPGYICSGVAFSDGSGQFNADLTPDNIVVDNLYGSMFLIAGGNSPNPGSGTSIAGMIVGYQLQVSSAPPMPSFNDVPATHPFFQFIEALKASGITGGCSASPPLYCPDAPLTRGQMAVFLSKALGLQFP